MNVEIVQGRIVDPASNLDAAGGIYIANGRIAGIGQAPARFPRRSHARRARRRHRARPGRPVCAITRARLRGRAEGRDARSVGRRRDRRRVPAGHRPAARRAGPGAHAAAALARSGRRAHLSAWRADGRAPGRGAGRDPDAGRDRLRRLYADAQLAARQRRAAAGDALCAHLRSAPLAATGRGHACRHRGRGGGTGIGPAGTGLDTGGGGDGGPAHDLRTAARQRGARAHVPPLIGRGNRVRAPGEGARACLSRPMSRSTMCT